MKKNLILLLVVSFILGFSAFTALTDTVEISLRVGENTLYIGGESIEVEPPFIVDGTTLVPVCVVATAFGAEVGWNSDTQKVTLTYQDVEIVLQIDNINVYVNAQRQTLPVEPSLTNGVTMVPLRFISESFGAYVSWDEATQTVLVTVDEITDLSDIVDGMRLFEYEDWAISFRVPDEWFESSDFRRENHFMLATSYGTITMGAVIEVASVQSEDSAERWAREALEQYQRLYCPQTYTLSELRATQINGIDAYYFEMQIDLSYYALSSKMLFWEYEGYMYNLYTTVLRGSETLMQRIINSVRFDAIDPDVVGDMTRTPIDNLPIAFNSVNNSAMGFSVDIPVTWERLHNNSRFSCTITRVGFDVTRLDEPLTVGSIDVHLNNLVSTHGATIVRQPTSMHASELSSALSGFVVEYRIGVPEPTRIYHTIQHSIISDNSAFLITIIAPEHTDSPLFRETIATMIRSFTVN